MAEPDRTGLDRVEHVVVLMMENRSFDHMLGYLSLDRVIPEVEGLTAEMGNHDDDDVLHPVAPMGTRLINEKVLDPGHGRGDAELQLSDGNDGFLKSYAKALARNKRHHPWPEGMIEDLTLVLGYQQARDVPVYDYLARNYQVCDHWFSSVPGPTWDNRLFAIAGKTGPRVPPELLGHVPEKLRAAPIYDEEAFTRWLDDDQWRWYSHDPATLRLIDSRYRPGGSKGAGRDDNFAYFNRSTLFERRTFLDDVARGELPAVSWIDPNFVDFRLYGPPGSNDDHPPSRVMLGQELVLTVVSALARSPHWDKTLLLITYDEHGGFFDHVPPGDFPVAGGDGTETYGVRVPTLAVSPLVEPGVNHVVFDHPSIIKTILLRFAEDPDEALAAFGPRTAQANHLGALLTREQPRAAPTPADLEGLTALVRDWKLAAYRDQLLEEPTVGEGLFEAISDLQSEIVSASLHLRGAGHPPGMP